LAVKKKTFDEGKGVRAIARDRLGPVPSTKVIASKVEKKPKHKKKVDEEGE
jgi:hypothetical protein